MVDILLNQGGADPNKPCEFDGNTPLHLSISAGYKKITDLLVEAGAQEHKTNALGLMPWEGLINKE